MEKILDVELKTGRKSCGPDAIIQYAFINIEHTYIALPFLLHFFTIRVVQNYYCTNLSRI